MLKITNTQKGPRGVNAVAGPVLIDPDQTVEVEVYEREKEHIEATGWFKVKGDYASNPDGSPATALADVGDSLAAKDAEIAELKKMLADAQKKGADPAIKAEHHGGGKFNITQGEKVLASGLSKADADAFNAMGDEDKAAFLKAKG